MIVQQKNVVQSRSSNFKQATESLGVFSFLSFCGFSTCVATVSSGQAYPA